jgi:hypothetical protein
VIPAAHRERVDISINGSYRLGGIGGALLAVLMLNTSVRPQPTQVRAVPSG